MISSESPQVYDPGAIAAYFDELGTGEWDRLVSSPVQEIRLHVHEHILRTSVPVGARVLEIGAGPGRFTKTLAELGCDVTVADLSPVQLELNRRYAHELGFASCVADWVLADVCDLTPFPDASFDVVVAYGGPISYALDRRADAVRACARVTRPEGLVLAGVMSLWGAFNDALPGVLSLPPELNRRIVDTGDLTAETLPGSRHHCHMFRADEFAELLTRCGLQVVQLAAPGVLSTGWADQLADIRALPDRWNELLALERAAAFEPGLVEMSNHLVAVARKYE